MGIDERSAIESQRDIARRGKGKCRSAEERPFGSNSGSRSRIRDPCGFAMQDARSCSKARADGSVGTNDLKGKKKATHRHDRNERDRRTNEGMRGSVRLRKKAGADETRRKHAPLKFDPQRNPW